MDMRAHGYGSGPSLSQGDFEADGPDPDVVGRCGRLISIERRSSALTSRQRSREEQLTSGETFAAAGVQWDAGLVRRMHMQMVAHTGTA